MIVPADRLPPHNIEAELRVLGSVLLDNATLHDIQLILRPEDFYRDAHERIYRAMLAVHDRCEPVELLSLIEELDRRGEMPFDGRETIEKALEDTPYADDAAYHAKIVCQRSVARELIGYATQLQADVYSKNFTADELVERAERELFRLIEAREATELSDAKEAVADSLHRLAIRDAGAKPGLETGLHDFDSLTGGLHPGQLIVLAARPSIGKTALALNIAEHVALAKKTGVLFVSLEMVRGELGDRMICGRSGVDGFDFMHSKRLTDDLREAIFRAGEQLSPIPLVIDDATTRTVGQIASIGRRLRLQRQIGLIVVDYLQLVSPEDGKGKTPRHEQVAAMSRQFKGLAKELKIPVLLLSQLNREAEKRVDKTPSMADIRESGGVEQDANVVLLLHRPEFYEPGNRPGEADLIVAKNRNGATATVRLAFHRQTTRFSSIARQTNDNMAANHPF